MSRGKQLSAAEKFAIKGMIAEGIELKKMALHLGRTQEYIQKYIDKEELQNTTTSIEVVSTTEEENFITEATKDKVFRRLCQEGLSDQDAASALKRLILKFKRKLTEAEENNIDMLCTVARRDINPKDMFVTKTESKKKGVTIMTHGASGKVDDLKGKPRKSISQPHIFEHKSGTTR